ncbi:spike base protein, RCAP_Rcc01079 family [Litoreibacter arenae]|uniref:Uncharacterized protein n=1 Tax=Litoreibacter arenae DSM 19593 TaxID=1123360 RepID=S9RU95_9RHOB|nr:hypothetical protein [Litoreibacter arenae]EPX77514.1 phage-related hypothetical protein [Litoreibacter arenae DSM 19593]
MDSFSAFPTTPISPARSASTVVPDDTGDLPFVSRAIYVGQAGALSVEMVDGDTVTFESVPAGSMLPIRASKVNATGTTAAAIISLW